MGCGAVFLHLNGYGLGFDKAETVAVMVRVASWRRTPLSHSS
jgi:prophage maintenance system killer protein